MGPIKIAVVHNERCSITNDPFESAPDNTKSSSQQSLRIQNRSNVDSTSCDNRNETAPRNRNKVLKVIKASKAANANRIVAARAKESDQQMEKGMSIVHKLEMAKMAEEMKGSEQKLQELKHKAEEDINLLQLQYDALEHELSAKKIDADRASREFDDIITENLIEATENLVALWKEVKS
jgi:aspartyl-tRNA synthetase